MGTGCTGAGCIIGGAGGIGGGGGAPGVWKNGDGVAGGAGTAGGIDGVGSGDAGIGGPMGMAASAGISLVLPVELLRCGRAQGWRRRLSRPDEGAVTVSSSRFVGRSGQRLQQVGQQAGDVVRDLDAEEAECRDRDQPALPTPPPDP